MKRALCRGAKFALSFLTLLLFVTKSLYAADMPFYRELSLGSRGEDVRTLQKVLNKDDATKIRGVGDGSPGKETPYFGALTQDAVRRFQEKYREEILVPSGVVHGTGFVGRYTLAVLVRIGVDVVQDIRGTTTAVAKNTIGSSVKSSTRREVRVAAESKSTNPNLKNLDLFLSSLETSMRKQGKTEEEIALFTQQVKKDVATTTNLMQAFEELVKKSTVAKRTVSYSHFPPLFAFVAGFLKETFLPKQAYAATLAPFGGGLLFSFYCLCSDTWLILITPKAPTYVVLLSYVPFSQAFLSYNIPFTSWLIGFYIPGAGVCSVYYGYGCATFETEGMITPVVGSSPV